MGSKKPTFAHLAKVLLHQTPYFNFTIPFFNISLLFYIFFHNSQNITLEKSTTTLEKSLFYSPEWWTVIPHFGWITVHQLHVFGQLGSLMQAVLYTFSSNLAVFSQMLILVWVLLVKEYWQKLCEVWAVTFEIYSKRLMKSGSVINEIWGELYLDKSGGDVKIKIKGCQSVVLAHVDLIISELKLFLQNIYISLTP